MVQPYPKEDHLVGNFAPIRMECNIDDLIIDGEIPEEINGTYYRNGPDPKFPPRGAQPSPNTSISTVVLPILFLGYPNIFFT